MNSSTAAQEHAAFVYCPRTESFRAAAVVVVGDSRIQRIVLATEKTTVTYQMPMIPPVATRGMYEGKRVTSQVARTCILRADVVLSFCFFTDAAALRSIVLRSSIYACDPSTTRSYLTHCLRRPLSFLKKNLNF